MRSGSVEPARHIFGFDYLRALFSVCVVAVHSGYVAPSDLFDRTRFESHVTGWSDVVNFDVLMLAVPIFALMSCFLLATKPAADERLGQRLLRTSRLLIFWTLLYLLSEKGLLGAIQAIGAALRHNPVRFLFTAGDTIFYFFSALLLLLQVTSLAKRLSVPIVWSLFALSLATIAILPPIAVWSQIPTLVHHANPLNFLPLAFAAVGMQSPPFERNGEPTAWAGMIALVAGGLATILDWTIYRSSIVFEVNSFAVPAYTRPSVVLLAIGVVQMARLVQRPPGAVISFMSRHSLALYCIHPFVLTVVYRVMPRLHLAEPARFIVCTTSTIAASYVLALILPAFFRKELLS